MSRIGVLSLLRKGNQDSFLTYLHKAPHWACITAISFIMLSFAPVGHSAPATRAGNEDNAVNLGTRSGKATITRDAGTGARQMATPDPQPTVVPPYQPQIILVEPRIDGSMPARPAPQPPLQPAPRPPVR